MKALKKITVLLILVLTSSLFVNCSSDSNGSNNDSNSFYLKFKINGEQVTFADPTVINSLSKSITGFTTNGKSMSLYLPLDVTTGTFTITDEPSNVEAYGASYSDFANDESSDNETGTLTITQVDADVIKGIFSFTGTNLGTTYTVTEGEFRAENIQ
jgi:ABC-type Fe3+-hydroxamate transport system substrate-binding protein